MQTLKYVLYFFLAIVILFFALGLLNPTIEYGHEITVNKPLKEAWAVSMDTSKYDQWLEGFKSIERISGEEDVVGSKYKVVVNPGEGQEDFEMIETVVAKEEFDHVDLHFDSDMMIFTQKILYDEAGGQTTIKTESTVSGKGIMMRSMFAAMELFGDPFETQEAKNLEALKRLIEENTTDYYPPPPASTTEVMAPEEVADQ